MRHLNETNVVFQVTSGVKVLVRFEAQCGNVLFVRIGNDERIGTHSHRHINRLQSYCYCKKRNINITIGLNIVMYRSHPAMHDAAVSTIRSL